jgi:hypothetical protein
MKVCVLLVRISGRIIPRIAGAMRRMTMSDPNDIETPEYDEDYVPFSEEDDYENLQDGFEEAAENYNSFWADSCWSD